MGSEALEYIVWTMVLFLSYSRLAHGRDDLQYYTAYACDGKMLKIECKEGYVINVIRANYGRYSITVCNDHGSTDWSVNCMSPKSLTILQGRCNQKRNCSIQASTSLFSDPCPGTVKYLEAHYYCASAAPSSSTSRPTPPWLMTSPPNVWVTPKAITVQPEIVVPATPSSTSTSTPSTTTNLQKEESEENYWTISNTLPPSIEIPSEPQITVQKATHEIQSSTENLLFPNNNDALYCKPVNVRNVSWNWTTGGDILTMPCPGGATGYARWRCQTISSNLAIWFPETPDLSECRSVWLTSLESRILENDSLTKIASDLCQVTESKMLYGGDMLTTAKIIRDIALKMSKDILEFPDPRQREAIVYDLLYSVARIGSNLLDLSQQPSWKDLSYKEQMRAATLLLIGLEENSFLLAETMAKEKVVTHCLKNMMVSVRVLEMRNVVNEEFPTSAENCSMRINNWIQLKRSSLIENSDGGLVRMVYIAFDTLEHILKLPINNKDSKKLNSKVLSASLGKGRHIQLNQPVIFCLQHLQADNFSNPSCVFWDYTQNTWSEEGCALLSTNETHTSCRCNHLTNFAILVDVKPTKEVAPQQLSVSIYIYIIIVAVSIMFIILLGVLVAICRAHRKQYGSKFDDGECVSHCFSCCRASSGSEKTLNCKEPRPTLYGNAETTEPAMHAARIATMAPRAYEDAYPPHGYPTYGRNGSVRRLKEARRLEHLENTLQYRANRKLACGSDGARSHTYSEIAGSSRGDPVYEEIEREKQHCGQVSDISDEDGKRNSDMSRQSSKSYGDHRPLIPYDNPVGDRNFHAVLDAAYRQQLNARTVSVLDGQTVVCHLQQPPDPRIYHKTVSHTQHHY